MKEYAFVECKGDYGVAHIAYGEVYAEKQKYLPDDHYIKSRYTLCNQSSVDQNTDDDQIFGVTPACNVVNLSVVCPICLINALNNKGESK